MSQRHVPYDFYDFEEQPLSDSIERTRWSNSSRAEDREFDSLWSKTNDVENVYLSLPSLAFSIIRIGLVSSVSGLVSSVSG